MPREKGFFACVMQSSPYVLQNSTTRGFLLFDTMHRRISDACMVRIQAAICAVGSLVV